MFREGKNKKKIGNGRTSPNVWFVSPRRKPSSLLISHRKGFGVDVDRVVRKKIPGALFISECADENVSSLARFPLKRENWSETAVSSTLHDCMLLCNSRPLRLPMFPPASLLFYTLNILRAARHDWLTLLFNHRLSYSAQRLYSRGSKTCFRNSFIYSRMCCPVWDYWRGERRDWWRCSSTMQIQYKHAKWHTWIRVE